MKQFAGIVTILCLVFGIAPIIAQENLSKKLILESNLPNNQSYNYSATETIVFKAPFEFKAQGTSTLRASISPLNLSPNPFSDYINGGSSYGIVGKISDEFDVTPSGQASYQIPIKLPGGTGGMAPNLSIVYNSGSKDGLLGYGFELAGLSVINRAPQNLHVDGNVTAVNFSSDDNLMLDGNRLIRVSPITVTANIEYRTENNSFAKIVSSSNPGSSNPLITVYTKDGLKYEYGSNLELRSTSSSNVENKDLFWPLTKVTDTKGNYFTISYNLDKEKKEYTPKKIEYTGNVNTNLAPYCSVDFIYENQLYAFTSYLSGMQITKTKNLKSIEVFYGSNKIKSYELKYQQKNNKKLLSSVTEVAADGKKLNPTTFGWSTVDDLTPIPQFYNSKLTDKDFNVYTGDFNGDGKMDFIAASKSNLKNWTLGLSDGVSFKTTTGSFSDDDITNIYIGDFNGDGISDMLIKRAVEINSDGRYGVRYLTGIVYTSVSQNGIVTFGKAVDSEISDTRDFDIRIGDFNGDGISDALRFSAPTSSWGRPAKSAGYIYVSQVTETMQIKPLVSLTKEGREPSMFLIPDDLGRIEVVDFNGDGLADIVHINKNGCYLHKNTSKKVTSNLNLTISFADPISSELPKVYNEHTNILLSDFNGDGKTDMLSIEPEANNAMGGSWYVRFSNGEKYLDPVKISPALNGFSNHKLFSADINGDGFTDFMVYDKTSTGNKATLVRYYINNGDGINYTEYTGHSDLPLSIIEPYIGDFNGDGRADVLSHASSFGRYNLITGSTKANNLLSSITDGLGNRTSIDYLPMSNRNVHEKGTTSAYPINSFTSGWYVVSSIKTSSSITNEIFSNQSFKYKNALLHSRGRGFLGFEYFISKDVINKTETTTQFEVNTKEYTTAVKSVEVKANGKLISKSENTNKLTYYNNQHIFTYGAVASREIQYEYNTGVAYSDISSRTEYDSYGNITRLVTKYSTKDSIVNVNKYDNDTEKWHLGRLKESTVTKISPKGSILRTSKFDYNSTSGLLYKEEVEPSNTQLGYTKTYEHDAYGNILSSTTTPKDSKVAPRTQSSVYDPKGRFEVKSTNELGHTTNREINYSLGLVTSETNPNELKTEYIYDSFGQLLFTKTPLGNTQTVLRWSKGHSDAPNKAVYFSYTEISGAPPALEFFDGLGRSLRKKVIGFDGKAIYTDIKYNTKGQPYLQSEPYFNGSTVYWNTLEYDDVGRVVKQIYPDATFHTFTFDGLTTKTTSPLGLVDTKVKDIYGRLAKSIDNKQGSVTYSYDAAGNCEIVEGPRTKIIAEFDVMGNRTKLIDPDLGTINYKYNAYGELVYQKDAKNNETIITYDTGGRIKTKNTAEGTITYTYDTIKKGMLTSVTSPKYSQSFLYDDYCRIKTLTEVIDGKTFSTHTTYDKFNRVDKITYPSSLIAIGSTSNFAVRHIYNDNGYLSEVKNAQSNQSYWKAKTMNARGQMEQFVLGNGLETTTQYNPQKGYVTNIKTPGKGSATAIQDWTYAFNDDGNLISRKDNKRNMTESFTYDGLNRLHLTYHQIGNGSKVEKERVDYDAAGNITYKTGIGTTFTYQEGTNRLLSVSGGNYNPPAWESIEYTSFNKISKVVQGNNSLILIYGADQKRKKSVTTKNGKSDIRYYAGAIYEEDHLPTGEIKQRHYIFANGGMIAIHEQSNTSGESIKYVHKDHLGSVQAYSDKDGKLIQELSYDAWGRRRSADEWKYYLNLPDANALHERGFTGHEHLDIFEMINMDGRMYDPMLGRFLTPDPFVQAPDYTQGLNRYIYCLNNPLSLVDPSGYSWLSKNWKSLFTAAFGVFVATIPGGQGLGAVLLAGVLGGAASGFAGAVFNGANIGAIAKSAVTGAFWGGVSAGLSKFAGDIGTNFIKNMLAHSVSQGLLEGVKGGNMKHGFISGLVSSAGASGVMKFGESWSTAGKVAANAVIGGTAAELGGGKFANGAITSAYALMFNHLQHQGGDEYTPLEVITADDGTYIVTYSELGTPQYHIIGEPGLEPIYVEIQVLGTFGPQKVVEAINALKTMLNIPDGISDLLDFAKSKRGAPGEVKGKEHTANARQSTKGKHEAGQARKQQKFTDKKRNTSTWKRNK